MLGVEPCRLGASFGEELGGWVGGAGEEGTSTDSSLTQAGVF